ncbi:hypothetical protein NKH77_50495 [Streptomyces sp. M19]
MLARLGGGGMGGSTSAGKPRWTWAGRRLRARALVAVKVIRPEHAEDARFRRRFEREVESVRRVHGRYTAGLLGSGFDEEERLWMATSYVPGLSLDDAVRRFGPLPAPVVWRLAGEIGRRWRPSPPPASSTATSSRPTSCSARTGRASSTSGSRTPPTPAC